MASARTKRKPKAPAAPIQIVLNPDGSPMTEWKDDCPLCRMLRAQGVPVHTLGDHGELVEIAPAPLPPAFDVWLQAAGHVVALLGAAPGTVPVPVGCIVGDFVEMIAALEPGLRDFPDGALRVLVNGEPADPRELLRPGDCVVLTADAPPVLWSRP